MANIFRANLFVSFLLFLFVVDVFGDVAAITKLSKPSVVTISTQVNGSDESQGSGFLLVLKGEDGTPHTVVITNVHVIAGATGAKIKFTDGTEISVEGVAASNVAADIAALSIGPVKYGSLKLATKPLEAGERVIALGTPLGLEFTVTDGIVSATRKAENVTWLQHTAPISSGNSGGPLLNQKGEVVGVNTFKRVGGENLNFACSFEMLENLKVGKSQSLSAWSAKHKTTEKSLPKEVQGLPDERLERARNSYKEKQKQATASAIEQIKRSDIPQIAEQMKEVRLSKPANKDDVFRKSQRLRELQTKQRELGERLSRLERGIEVANPTLRPGGMRVGDVGHISSAKLVGVVTNDTAIMQSFDLEFIGQTPVRRTTSFFVNGLATDDFVTGTIVSIIPPLVVIGTRQVGIDTYYELVAFNVEESKQEDKDSKPSPKVSIPDKEAPRTNEEDAKAQLSLAKLYFEAKKEGLALHLLRKIIAEFPDTQAAVEAQKLIDKHVSPAPAPTPTTIPSK